VKKLLIILLLLPLSVFSQTVPVDSCKIIMHRLLNEYRVENGSGVLILDDTLTQLAQKWAKHMYDVDKIYHSNYGYAENCLGYGRLKWKCFKTETGVERWLGAWELSSAHNENMLDYNHKKVGYGFYDGYYVQLFD